jgi:hypothetical protein
MKEQIISQCEDKEELIQAYAAALVWLKAKKGYTDLNEYMDFLLTSENILESVVISSFEIKNRSLKLIKEFNLNFFDGTHKAIAMIEPLKHRPAEAIMFYSIIKEILRKSEYSSKDYIQILYQLSKVLALNLELDDPYLNT